MNANDPILTAYALDELDPHERAQVAQLLRENPKAADELDRIRAVANVLSSTLPQEHSEGLSAKHREQVLAVAGATQKLPLPANIVEGPSWWKSWQFATTAAACMVFGFGAYAIFDALTSPRPNYATAQKGGDALAIGVPSDDADRRHLGHVPETPGHPSEPRTPSSKLPLAAVPPPTKAALFPPEIRGQLQPPNPLPQIGITPEPEVLADTPPRVFAGKSRGGKEPMVGFAQPLPNPSCFIQACLVRPVPPLPQREDDALWQLAALLHSLHLSQQSIRGRKGDDLGLQVRRHVRLEVVNLRVGTSHETTYRTLISSAGMRIANVTEEKLFPSKLCGAAASLD